MNDFFKAELLRFRTWAILVAAVNLVALAFMTRVVDLAQQPTIVYQVLGMVYAAAGTLLGLYQMGSYRRPNHWLNLLHRPLHRLRIAAGLCSAGGVLLVVAVALPIALVALYQDTWTARVVDLRHWLLSIAALMVAWCGYLAGAYAMLANRRYSAAVVMLPVLFMFSQASGLGFMALQGVVLLFLAALVAIAFKPDLAATPRAALPVIATALPVQVAAYFLLWMLGFGVELSWTAAGSHPLSMPKPPAGGYIEANQAEPGERLLLGIVGSRAPEAPLWREQIALSEASVLYPMRETYMRQQLTNPMQPPEFDDEVHATRWVFSHDRMRFVGYGVLDGRPRGELGVGEANAPFDGPVLPFLGNMLFSPGSAYQYDQDQQRVHLRVRLPDGEVFASPPQSAGDNIAVVSNRALYFYPGREAGNTLDMLQPVLRVPMPGAVGHLSSVELVELLDGYLVSFSFTNAVWSGEALPYQVVVRVDGNGRVHEVARRKLGFDLPLAYTMRTWWLSPALRALCLQAQHLFAPGDPLKEGAIPSPPPGIVVLAAVLCVLSLLAAIWLTGRQSHSTVARWTWILACGVIGVPALLSLWLLYPPQERTEALPLARPATA
jgi:hypothetical protein